MLHFTVLVYKGRFCCVIQNMIMKKDLLTRNQLERVVKGRLIKVWPLGHWPFCCFIVSQFLIWKDILGSLESQKCTYLTEFWICFLENYINYYSEYYGFAFWMFEHQLKFWQVLAICSELNYCIGTEWPFIGYCCSTCRPRDVALCCQRLALIPSIRNWSCWPSRRVSFLSCLNLIP